MPIRALVLLLLPLLCATHNIGYRSSPAACPTNICVCSESKVTRRGLQQYQQEAVCKEMPWQRLSRTITSLQVTGQITSITKRMMATLGGDLLSLDVSNCGVQNIEPGALDFVPKLVTLKLSDNIIEEIGPRTFKKNGALRELYLDGNRLKHIDEAAFAKLDQLRELHVERNFLTEFPSKIPLGLSILNVSQNNLGPKFSCDLRESNLKELDLCGNHLEQIDNSTLLAMNKLQHLCIGDRAVHFPEDTATHLPHLSDLALVASTETHAVLDSTTQTALAHMETLTSLTIVNYKIESMAFIHGLCNLRNLKLQDITSAHMVDFQSLMLSKTSLVVLNLEGSTELAHTLLDNIHVLRTLTSLHTISFRNTKITHLAAFDMPHTNHTHLDISNNPLKCDCGLAWLRNDRQNTSVRYTILNSEETVCAEPSEYSGQKLIDVVNRLDCVVDSGTPGVHPVNRRYTGRRRTTQQPRTTTTTTTTTAAHEDEYDYNYDDGDSGHPGNPVRFPSHPPAGTGSEFNNHGLPSHPGTPVKFPTNPHQGKDPDFPTNPHHQGEESGFPTNPHEGQEPDYPTNPHQGQDPDFPTNPHQGEESELPTNPHQGQEPDHPTNPQQGGETEFPANPHQGEVSEMPAHSSESNTDHSETTMSAETEPNIDHTPEYMPIHEGDKDEDSTSNIVYIILGTLLGLLLLVGLILAIFYWQFKKNGHNKIEPETAVPSTTDTTPVEPSYQHLKHNEGSSLLHNVKK